MILQIYIIHLKKQVFCKLFINIHNHSGGRYKKAVPSLRPELPLLIMKCPTLIKQIAPYSTRTNAPEP